MILRVALTCLAGVGSLMWAMTGSHAQFILLGGPIKSEKQFLCMFLTIIHDLLLIKVLFLDFISEMILMQLMDLYSAFF